MVNLIRMPRLVKEKLGLKLWHVICMTVGCGDLRVLPPLHLRIDTKSSFGDLPMLNQRNGSVDVFN